MDLTGGDRLMLLRKKAGKTQKEIGAAVGLSYQAVSEWERGHSKPRLTPYRMWRLCQVLNCSLEELALAFPEDNND